MSLPEDCEALESFPLRLMIVAVVAAMSVVPAAEAIEVMEDRDFVARACATMDRLVLAAQALSIQGPGASRTVDVDLSSSGSLNMVQLAMGDELDGPRVGTLVLELSSGARVVRTAQDPPVAITSPFGRGLVVCSERFSLRMSAQRIDDRFVVVAEVL